ncbi:MAG: AraC family transcriptional regulator [Planctomycetes bacterium]|nr:AraC family transcriptional regulator [Planctomycetota bacterium]
MSARGRKPPTAAPDAEHLLAFALVHAHVSTWICSRPTTADDSYVLLERTVPDYNLIHAQEGRAVWTIDGVDHVLETGDLVLVPPGVRHHARSASARMAIGSVHVLATLPGGQDLFALLVPPRQRRVAAGCRLDAIMRLAIGEVDRERDTATAMLAHWGPLVAKELLRHDHAAGALRANPLDPLVVEILEHLERHLAQPLSLGDLAKRSGYSPQHLNRRFTAALGLTPLACLSDMRLQRAASLLRDGVLTIAAIGARVGLGDAAYFSRVFRKRYGRTPSDWRDHAGSGNPS